MSQVLAFALGIESSEFIKGVGEGSHKLLEFIGIAEAGKKALEGFSGAMERGARIFNRGMATGENIRALYQTEEALKNVGLTGEDAQGLMLRLQRALSGVSESGERTAGAFGLMHLNMLELRQLDPARQLVAVSDALSTLDRSSATGAASILFGRQGFGSILQISRQAESFRDAFKEAGEGGNLFQNLAPAFNKLLTTVDEIKSRFQLAFAAASKGFIVPLQSVLTALKNVPWQEIGEGAGLAMSGIFEAFREGKLAILIGDTFRIGFESAETMAPAIFARIGVELLNILGKIGIFMLEMFKTPLNFLQAGMTFALQKGMEGFAKMFPKAADFMGFGGMKADSWSDIWTDQKKHGPIFDFGTGEAGIGDANSMMNMVIAKLREKSNQFTGASWDSALKQLQEAWGNITWFAKRAPRPHGTTEDPNALPGTPQQMLTQFYKPNNNPFEKMGFIFNGGGNSGLDYARRTALATERTAVALSRIAINPTSNPRGRNRA